MANPERPGHDLEDDEDRFEDEGRPSIFSALWFRAILVVVALGIVAAVAVPYILELANQPPTQPTSVARPDLTPPPSAAVAAPPPVTGPASTPPAAETSPATEQSLVTARPAPAPAPTPSTATEKSDVAAKTAETGKAAVAEKRAAPRSAKAMAPSGAATSGGGYFVQVGAFKSQESAKRLAMRLRGLKYSVEESATTVATRSGRDAAAPSGGGAGSDRYDVHVTGAAPAEINAKLSGKGLAAEPSGAGVVVKPSLPLRDAVALSKDLAVDGLKVQVRRAGGGSAASATSGAGTSAPSGDPVYRVRVGPFDDRMGATSTLRELEQRGYTPFIARGGQ